MSEWSIVISGFDNKDEAAERARELIYRNSFAANNQYVSIINNDNFKTRATDIKER